LSGLHCIPLSIHLSEDFELMVTSSQQFVQLIIVQLICLFSIFNIIGFESFRLDAISLMSR